MISIFKKSPSRGLSSNRFALAIQWNDRILLHPEHLSASGNMIISGPWILLAPDAPETDLGHELLVSLRSSKKGISEPADPQRILTERCRLAGVRAERDLALGALFVQAFTTPDHLVLMPTRSGISGRELSIRPLEDRRIELELDSPDEIVGKRLRRAWQVCSLI